MLPTYLDPRTGQTFPLDQPRWCGSGHAPLLLTPLPGITRAEIDTGTRSLWRYRTALPMQVDDPITMGEGCTPLIRRTLHGAPALLKCEWFMPTGSFKDRGASVMLSLLRAQGIRDVLEDSSGNGGAAVSAYAAAGGMHATIMAPASTSPAKTVQMRAHGADGRADPGHAAGHRRCRGAAVRERLLCQPQLASVLPARHQDAGLRAVGRPRLPRARQHHHRRAAPDRMCSAARSAFPNCCARARSTPCRASSPRSRRTAGRSPRRSMPAATGQSPPRSGRPSPRAPRSRSRSGLPKCSATLRETRGGAVMLTEAEIGAATLSSRASASMSSRPAAQVAAAFRRLLDAGTITPEQTTVLVLTGSGLKATPRIAELLGVTL